MGQPQKMDVQTERSFQKQPHMFQGKTRLLSRSSRKGARYVKSIGLGFKVPAAAKEGRYIDKKCPFAGEVSIRGKILRGVVHRTFMKNTITIRRDYLHFQKKYRRYEKRHKMISAHCSPAFDARLVTRSSLASAVHSQRPCDSMSWKCTRRCRVLVVLSPPSKAALNSPY